MVLKFGNHEETPETPVTWRTRTISLPPTKSSKSASIRIHFRDMKKICVPIRYRKREDGFARADLLACLCGVFLLAVLALPMLAAVADEGKIQACQSNLKDIGLGFNQWADNHGQRMPWRVGKEDGGAYGMSTPGRGWLLFYFLTNHLESPKVLACPADDAVNAASNWGRRPEGGYFNPTYRANAVSYLVGLDVRPEAPQSILSGDRNLEFSSRNLTCDYAKMPGAASLEPRDESVQWQNSIHLQQGNILFRDGSVATQDSPQLRNVLPATKAAHAENHVLPPR
jgi:hypothetical protein